MTSAPPPPSMVSAPEPPEIVLAPDEPAMESALPIPVALTLVKLVTTVVPAT